MNGEISVGEEQMGTEDECRHAFLAFSGKKNGVWFEMSGEESNGGTE